jgi:hypothetical protein
MTKKIIVLILLQLVLIFCSEKDGNVIILHDADFPDVLS